MKAIQELMNEHEGIQVMLGILQSVTKKIVAGESVPKKELEGILEFLLINAIMGKRKIFCFRRLKLRE